MTEADAEDWCLCTEFVNDFLGNARILRESRTGGDHDALVFFCTNLVNRYCIVSDDFDLCAEVREELIDVIGK